MVSQIVQKLNAASIKDKKMTPFSVGDVIKVHVKIREGDKERIQAFAGTVIARDGSGATETFTVRRISHGVGVERAFPLYSPHIAKIDVESPGRSRRAKLYYLREMTGKKAKQQTQAKRQD
jgi:large subunit ribosomal protein L19